MADNPRIDDLRRRLQKEPGSRLFAQLAEELRKEGEFEEAIRLCREGLQKHASYPSARMTLGRALFDTGDLAAARAEFETVLKGAPDNILASRLLGESLEGLGDLEGALGRYRATLSMAPGDKQLQIRLQEVQDKINAPPQQPAPAAEPLAPIPLVAVDEDVFELEKPFEAKPPTPAPVAAPLPVPATGRVEPAGATRPVPVVSAEPFAEADGSVEAVAPAASLPVAAAAAAAPVAAEVGDFEFEVPSPQTIPFEASARVRLEEEAFVAPAVAAPTAPSPAPAPATAAAGQDTEIATPTLAELYFSQGVTDKAVAVYRELLQREPANERVRARLGELEALGRHLQGEGAAAPAGRAERRAAVQRTVQRLEGFLAAIQRGARP